MRVRTRVSKNIQVPARAVTRTGQVKLNGSYTASRSETMADVDGGPWRIQKAKRFEEANRLGAGKALANRLNYEQKLRASGVPRVNPCNYFSSETEIFYESLRATYLGYLCYSVDGPLVDCLGNSTIVSPALGPSLPSTPLVDLGFAMALCKHEVLKRVGSPEYSFGEPIAEIGKTIALIRSPLRSISKLAQSFRNENARRKTSGVKAAKRAADVWLEYRFGFRPLVKTVDDSLQALAINLHRKNADHFKRVSYSKDVKQQSTTIRQMTNHAWQGTAQSSYGMFNSNITCVRTAEGRARCGVWVYHSDQGSLQALLGLRARDIPATLWELVPLSFVIDRMWNVSGCLRAASVFLSSKVKLASGWESTRLENRTETWVSSMTPTGAYSTSIVPSKTRPKVTKSFSMTRAEWKPSMADVKPPARAGRLMSSLTNCTDLAALAIQRISGGMRL